MTDKEFIAGIISGDYTINDVAKYCKTIVDVNALCDAMIGEYWDGFSENTEISYIDPSTGKLIVLNPDYGKHHLADAIYYIEKEILHNAPELPKNCKHMADEENAELPKNEVAEPPKEEVTMHQYFNGDEACKYKRYSAIKAYCNDNKSIRDLVKVFVTAHKMKWINEKPQFKMVCDWGIKIPINPKTGESFKRQSFEYFRDKYYKGNKYSNDFDSTYIEELNNVENTLNELP